MRARTNTLGSGVADSKTDITRRALDSPIRGATGPGFRHAILACATIDCETKSHVSAK